MTTIEQKIEEFEKKFAYENVNGENILRYAFCNNLEELHKNLKSFLRQALEQVREETIAECEKAVPKEEKLPKSKCVNLENHMFGSCFACEKIKGFNTCRSETLANIQALRNLDKL